MFTGIVEGTGKITWSVKTGGGIRIRIHPFFELRLSPGDSISVDGVCLTVEKLLDREFEVFLTGETLSRTKFGNGVRKGQSVNLEPPMTPDRAFGGHLVTGHVDTTGKLKRSLKSGDGALWELSLPEKKYMKYLVEKGSVAVDGVSLTVVKLLSSAFSVALIPFTLKKTTFKEKKIGDLLNIEFDLIGKYVEKFLRERGL